MFWVDPGGPTNQKTVFFKSRRQVLTVPHVRVMTGACWACRARGFPPLLGASADRMAASCRNQAVQSPVWGRPGGDRFRGVARLVASLDKLLRTEKQKSRLQITPRTKCSERSTCPPRALLGPLREAPARDDPVPGTPHRLGQKPTPTEASPSLLDVELGRAASQGAPAAVPPRSLGLNQNPSLC